MRDFFKKNLGLKLVSLVMALSLEIWFISPQNLALDTISAAVEIQGLAPDRVVVWPPAAEEGLLVDFKIRGPGPLVQEIRDTPKKFTVVLPPRPTSPYLASLNSADLKLPHGVELLEIKPAKFEFRIEEIIKREVKVAVSQVGEPPLGIRVELVEPLVEKISVTGPRGEISQLDTIETEDVDISQYNDSVELEVPIRPIGSRITFEPERIKVSVRVAPIEAERVFPSFKVSINAPEGYAASMVPSKVDATFTGKADLLNIFKAEGVQLVADLSQTKIEPKEKLFHSARVAAIGLPNGIRLIGTNPERVEVTLYRK